MPLQCSETECLRTNRRNPGVSVVNAKGLLSYVGPGPERRSRVRETRQGRTARFGRTGGLELGFQNLAWKIVVKKHHGDLRVESAPGDTRFIVLLPLEMPPVVDGALPSDGDGADDQEKSQTS